MSRNTIGAAFFVVVLVSTMSGGSARKPDLSRRHHHGPIIVHERHGRNVTSHNWSGYAVTGASGSVTDAKGSWIVPSVSCQAGDQYASFWVGIDGYTSNTVEQIGTDSDCVNGVATYYAWYEFYPHFAYTINTITVKPGAVISAEVSVTKKGGFAVTITEATGHSFSVSTKMPNAQMSSAEWIAEAPYSGGVLPLANFMTASFGNNFTGAANTCYAMVGGNWGPIGSFGPTNVAEITMVNGNGAIKAKPLGLSSPDGSSFAIQWMSAGS
jgi:hypothetical protein